MTISPKYSYAAKKAKEAIEAYGEPVTLTHPVELEGGQTFDPTTGEFTDAGETATEQECIAVITKTKKTAAAVFFSSFYPVTSKGVGGSELQEADYVVRFAANSLTTAPIIGCTVTRADGSVFYIKSVSIVGPASVPVVYFCEAVVK